MSLVTLRNINKVCVILDGSITQQLEVVTLTITIDPDKSMSHEGVLPPFETSNLQPSILFSLWILWLVVNDGHERDFPGSPLIAGIGPVVGTTVLFKTIVRVPVIITCDDTLQFVMTRGTGYYFMACG